MQVSDKSRLVRLSDVALALEHPAEDVRDFHVKDTKGEDIGIVDDLMVDDQSHKVQFLIISEGGFLGMGKTRFLIPVDTVTNIDLENRLVHVDRTREHVASSPGYDPGIVEQEPYLSDVYSYYGIAPYWGAGYVYPPYPFILNGGSGNLL
jgi:sporulation protein YlmC with PRC-barrel domain